MKIKQLDFNNNLEIKLFKQIYKDSFPRTERKSFYFLKRLVKQNKGEILLLMDQSTIVGIAVTLTYQDLVLLDYFAIQTEYQNQGYGSEALKSLISLHPNNRFLLEIETPNPSAKNNQQRISRKNFYLREGLTETCIYINLFSVNMELLC